MSLIKKVLANVVQTLTSAEKHTACVNIGLGTVAAEPPTLVASVHAGSLVWDPDHYAVYRLLEDWHGGTPWADVKKVKVAPYGEGDPLCVNVDFNDIGHTVSGLYASLTERLGYGKPYIQLDFGDDDYAIFELSRHGGSAGQLAYFEFISWESAGSTPIRLDFMRLTVNASDTVTLDIFKVTTDA